MRMLRFAWRRNRDAILSAFSVANSIRIRRDADYAAPRKILDFGRGEAAADENLASMLPQKRWSTVVFYGCRGEANWICDDRHVGACRMPYHTPHFSEYNLRIGKRLVQGIDGSRHHPACDQFGI